METLRQATMGVIIGSLLFFASVLLLGSSQTKASLDELPKYRIGEVERSIGFYQAIELVENSLLHAKKSKYQDIEVHQSKFYGKVLVLDGGMVANAG